MRTLRVTALMLLAGCQSGPERLISLKESIEPLRQHFNSDRQRLRVVCLFSPV